MEAWRDFFAAEVGASAALVGLVIVAISINLGRILSFPALPGRAAETLVAPSGVMVAASYLLVPDPPHVALGSELIAAGAAMWLLPVYIQVRALASGHGVPRSAMAVRFVLTQLYSLPFLYAGVLSLQGAPGVAAATVPGVIAALMATVINAWVLLVEILR